MDDEMDEAIDLSAKMTDVIMKDYLGCVGVLVKGGCEGPGDIERRVQALQYEPSRLICQYERRW